MSWKTEHQQAKLASLGKKGTEKQYGSGSKRANSITSMSNTKDLGSRNPSLPTFQLTKSFLSPSNADFNIDIERFPLALQIKAAMKPLINPRKRLDVLRERQMSHNKSHSHSGLLPPINNRSGYSQTAQQVNYSDMQTRLTNESTRLPAEDKDAQHPNDFTERESVEPKEEDDHQSKDDNSDQLSFMEKPPEVIGHEEILRILKQINGSELLTFEDFKPAKRINVIKGIRNRESQMIENSLGIGDRLRKIDLKLVETDDKQDLVLGEKEVDGEEQDMETIFKEFKNFASLHKVGEREMKERQLRLESMKQRSKEVNSILNDFRPKKAKNENQKEYYDKWYIPVEYWKIQKHKEQSVREVENLKNDDTFIYKNLHNYGRKLDSNPLKTENFKGPHQLRYELVQEKMRQSVVAQRFKQEILESGGRPPEFLSKIKTEEIDESDNNELDPLQEKRNSTRVTTQNK